MMHWRSWIVGRNVGALPCKQADGQTVQTEAGSLSDHSIDPDIRTAEDGSMRFSFPVA